MNTTSLANPPGVASMPRWASLWELFYLHADLPPIQIERLRADEVPQPYHSLLVHCNDMTPTLESFYRRSLHLTVLARWREAEAFFREVTLNLPELGRPVEYGVIRIFLDRFSSSAQRLILEGQRPLGSILAGENIAHLGWPNAFFRVSTDERVGDALWLERSCRLYGRRNLLLNGDRRILAEVIEVLAPTEPGFSPSH
jgi:chorismate-pyruvate lyase